jgi:hypothetical protein
MENESVVKTLPRKPATDRTVPSADAERERLRWLGVAVAIVGVVGFGLRYWLLRSPLGGLNSDEAATGMTAYDMLRGRPTLLIGGTTYGGLLEAWLAAPFIVEWFVACVAAAWAFRPVLKRAGALAVGAVVWVHSGLLVVLSTTAYLGYASGFVFQIAALGFLVRSSESTRIPRRTDFLAGLFAGLAVWGHPLFIVTVAPALAATLWLRRRHDVVPWLGRIAVGLLFGTSPLWIWNIRNAGAGLKSPPQTKVTSYGDRFEIALAQLAPRGLGLRAANGRWLYPRTLAMPAVLVIIVLALVGLIVLARRHRSGLVLAAAGLPAFILLPAFPNTWFADDGRYYTMITIPLLCGLVALVPVVARRLRLTAPTLLAFCVVVWGVVTCGRFFQTQVPRQFVDQDTVERAIIERLDRERITALIGDYWIVYRISYMSNDRITAQVPLSIGQDRFARLRERVAATSPEHLAYIFQTGQEAVNEIPNKGEGLRKVELAGVTLFLPPQTTAA